MSSIFPKSVIFYVLLKYGKEETDSDVLLLDQLQR